MRRFDRSRGLFFSALFAHEHLDDGSDVAMQFDRDVKVANFFQVLAQADSAPLNGQAFFLERFGYVQSGD